MDKKKQTRLRRAKKARCKIRTLEAKRLSIHRTPRHIYAQVISEDGQRILASASTIDKDVRKTVVNGGNISAAAAIGKIVAERAKKVGVSKVAFDRSGFKYHGRVKALADAARAHGLEF
jgi:large subunit ribosomal protein L18